MPVDPQGARAAAQGRDALLEQQDAVIALFRPSGSKPSVSPAARSRRA